MKPALRSGDFWSGLALAALGAYVLVTAHRWDYMTEEGPGAGFFPMWYGALMLALSLVLVVQSVVKPRKTVPGTFSSAENVPGTVLAWRALTAWAAFVACIALMPVAGFVVSFALLVAFIVKVMCAEKLRTAIVVAVAGALGFYLLFEVALDLTLPHGIWF